MADKTIIAGDIEVLSRAVEEAPLAPKVEEFLDSIELDEYERTTVIEVLDGLKFGGDGLKALPKTPPEIASTHRWF